MARSGIWNEEDTKKLKELALTKNIYEIVDCFEGKYTQKQIKSKCCCLKIKTQPIPLDMYKNRLNVNQYFFDHIDTPEKAYVLGYWIADGHMSGTQAGRHTIGFSSKDKCQLELVKKLMDAEQTIYSYKNRNYYELRINSILMYNTLHDMGFDNNKSSNAFFPKIKNSLHNHLIRGIFDGDGCISRTQKRQLSIHFVGTENLMISIRDVLNIHVNLRKIKDCNAWALSYYCSNAFQVLEYIYHDSEGLRLERKYRRYQDAINETGFYEKIYKNKKGE